MSPDIRELFDDAADDTRRAGIDAHALLRKGKRKVRIRRAGAAAGTGVLAAAAVLAITQFPRPAADGPVPPADTPAITRVTPTIAASSPAPSSPTPPSSPAGTVRPGLPESGMQTSGAELLRKISYAKAVTLCRRRMLTEYGASGTPVPSEIDSTQSQRNGMYVTDLLKMRMPDGSTEYCSVPGPAQPSKPGATTGDARTDCGRLTWTNLTSWTVAEQRDSAGGLSATLYSNDRKAILRCDIEPPGVTYAKTTAFPDAVVFLTGKDGGSPNGVLGAAPDATAVHWLGSEKNGRQFWGGGGPAKAGAVRYALFAGTHKLAEVKVFYGVYALRVWVPAGSAAPDRVVAYDTAGTIVDDYQPY